jgi:hypothetical protein
MDFEAMWRNVGGLKPIVGGHFQPLSIAEVEAIEAAIGSRLPEDYRVFLMTYGAAAFRRRVRFSPVLRLPSNVSYSGSDCIDAFYGKEPLGRDAYSLSHRMAFYKGRMPDSIIPIGDNGCGNQICLGVTGDLCGQVLYWDRNSEMDEEDFVEEYGRLPSAEERFENVHPISRTFAEFLHGLKADPDD